VHRIVRRLFLVLGALVAVAGVERGGAGAQTLPAVRIVSGTTEVSADVYYAYEMGSFRRAGLNVDLTQVRSGAVAAAAVAAGQADIADSNVLSFAQGRVRGLPFVAIAPGQNYDTSDPVAVIVAAPNATYRTGKDLNGTTVAVSSLGSVAELCADAWIDRTGGDLASVKLVEVTFAETVAAIEQGRVAAGVLSDPQLSSERSRIRILGKCYDAIAPRFLISVWFTTNDWVTKNPDLARRFASAMNDATEWAEKNPAQAKTVLEKWLRSSIAKIHHFRSRSLEPAMIQPLLDSATKYKILPRPLNATEFIWTGAPK
jgi:NitT/TauT family transport system substrate-binding protein